MVPNYDERYVTELFERLSGSYDIVNLVSSFGFSEIWRACCVRNLKLHPGATVADLMAGSGECWTYLQRRIGMRGQIVSIDICRAMCDRQRRRKCRGAACAEVRCENALALTLADESVDFVVSAFGLKTFDALQLAKLASEVFRVFRPGGSCSFLEISLPDSRLLRGSYRFYIHSVIPLIGRIFLGDIECYRMLGVYTDAFGSCRRVIEPFTNAGFEVVLKRHCFGCASSVVAKKPI